MARREGLEYLVYAKNFSAPGHIVGLAMAWLVGVVANTGRSVACPWRLFDKVVHRQFYRVYEVGGCCQANPGNEPISLRTQPR